MCSVRRNSAWFYKPGQLPITREVINLREKSTTAIFLKQYIFKLYTRYLFLHPHISVAFSLHQSSFILQQIDTVTEIHNWSKCREQETMGHLIKWIHPQYYLLLGFRGCWWKRSRNLIHAQGPSDPRYCSLDKTGKMDSWNLNNVIARAKPA